MWLLVPFLIIPMIEIALFILVGDWLGLWPTLGLVILAIFAGIMIIRLQGMRTVTALRQDMSAMNNPLSPMAHSALVILAGGLLILPGFFSDMIAILLLIRPLRTIMIGKMGSRVTTASFGGAGFGANQQGYHSEYDRDAAPRGNRDTITVIDGEYFEVDEETAASKPRNAPNAPPSGWTRH